MKRAHIISMSVGGRGRIGARVSSRSALDGWTPEMMLRTKRMRTRPRRARRACEVGQAARMRQSLNRAASVCRRYAAVGLAPSPSERSRPTIAPSVPRRSSPCRSAARHRSRVRHSARGGERAGSWLHLCRCRLAGRTSRRHHAPSRVGRYSMSGSTRAGETPTLPGNGTWCLRGARGARRATPAPARLLMHNCLVARQRLPNSEPTQYMIHTHHTEK